MKKIVLIILLIWVLSLTLACGNSAAYNNVARDYQKAVDEYSELHSEYNDLVTDYNELYSEYNELVNEYNDLNTTFKQYIIETEGSYQQLGDYLQEIPEIFEGAIVPPYLLVEDRKVYLVFRDLNDVIEQWHWSVEALEASIIMGQFMRKIEISDLKYLGLQDIANKFVKGSKYTQLSGQGKFLDFRPYVIEEPFEPLALSFFSRHPDDESKIKEVWNMVTQLNTYSKEITETPRLPLETLLLGGGDCEDLAILTASILKAMPAEWDVKLVYMDTDNPADLREINHVTVYIDTGKYETFVECTQGVIMSPWKLVDGFYLELQ